MIFQLPRFAVDYLMIDATETEAAWLAANDTHPTVTALLNHISENHREWWQQQLDTEYPEQWEARLTGAFDVSRQTADIVDVLVETIHCDGGEWDHHAGVLWAEVRRIAATEGAGA
jgi:hypothetical protein